MPHQKSSDYKETAVQYYLVEDKTQEEVCKIFKCSRRRWGRRWRRRGRRWRGRLWRLLRCRWRYRLNVRDLLWWWRLWILIFNQHHILLPARPIRHDKQKVFDCVLLIFSWGLLISIIDNTQKEAGSIRRII